MQISVTNAKSRLTELVRLAEAGDEVILTRHGLPAVKLVAVKAPRDKVSRRMVIQVVRKAAGAKASPGANAARSQDFLYDKEGLPE